MKTYCTDCGESLPATAKFCLACGAALQASAAVTLKEEIAEPVPAPVQPAVQPTAGLRVTGSRYQLQVSAKLLSWPRRCACCMSEPNTHLRAAASRTTGKRVRTTTTSWWDIPYCTLCLDHKAKFDNAPMALLPLALLGVFLWVLIASLTGSGGLGCVLGLAVGLVGIWPYSQALQKARDVMKPHCTAEQAAVQYLTWHGTFHTFAFTNRQYLDLFVDANGRKTMSDIWAL